MGKPSGTALPKISWDDVRLFAQIARAGSANAAATEMGVAHTTLSRRLRDLEARLGARLIDRVGNRTVLTPQGRQVLDAAGQIDAILDATIASLVGSDDKVEGDVRILITDGLASYWLMPRLPRMLERHPGLRLAWHTITRSDYYRQVGAQYDVCLTWRRPTNPELVAVHIGSVGFSFFASDAYVSRFGLPSTLEDMPDHSVLQFHGYITSPSFPRIVEIFERYPPAMVVESAAVAFPMMKQGKYAAFLPNYISHAETATPLHRAPWDVGISGDVWLWFHPKHRNVARIRAVVDEIRKLAVEGKGIWFD